MYLQVSGSCQTSKCIEFAGRVVSKMNTSADPCNDFYSYACGRFTKEQFIGPSQKQVDNFNLLSEENTKILYGVRTLAIPSYCIVRCTYTRLYVHSSVRTLVCTYTRLYVYSVYYIIIPREFSWLVSYFLTFLHFFQSSSLPFSVSYPSLPLTP